MNHLAHLFLAPDSAEARVGSLLGDFAHGLDTNTLPASVLAGLRHHRAVDAFTDTHPEVLACKALFSGQRRRFAGIALDVLFDHYLLRHWERYTDRDREQFIAEVYRDLAANQHLMPEKMARITQHMIQNDWFSAYADLENIGFALDRIAGRIRYPNSFGGVIEEIRTQDTALEQHFLAFFPQLMLVR